MGIACTELRPCCSTCPQGMSAAAVPAAPAGSVAAVAGLVAAAPAGSAVEEEGLEVVLELSSAPEALKN